MRKVMMAAVAALLLAACQPDPDVEFKKHIDAAQASLDKMKALQDENEGLEARKAELCRQIPDYAGCAGAKSH